MRNAVVMISRHVLRRIAHERQFARRKDRVAVIHRHDHQVVEIGGKHQRNTEHGQKISDQRALFVLGRIDGRDEAQTQLLCDDGSCHLQCRNRQSCGEAQYRADDQLLEQ